MMTDPIADMLTRIRNGNMKKQLIGNELPQRNGFMRCVQFYSLTP